MSTLSIAPYYPWRRVVVSRQSVSKEADLAVLDLRPDRRFRPRCSRCSGAVSRICSHEVRAVRDLNMAGARVELRFSYRKVYCRACDAVVVEQMEAVEPWQRVTRRLARFIHDLCKLMSVSAVADHLDLDWKSVKGIDKKFLQEQYGQSDYEGLRILAIDEIAVKRGHKYMTVVIDYQTGRVVWMGHGRSKETLAAFFAGMSQEQKGAVEAVAMDMWGPYIQAVGEALPEARIVFDLFHVVSAYGKVIDRVRVSEFNRASIAGRAVIRGSKYLLLKRELTRPEERERLRELLELNETLSTVYILRDLLVRIWRYSYRAWAAKALAEWCALARSVRHPELSRFARTLERHRRGILNHCDYPIHTSKLEGINNKIKVIKRQAYGYHESEYFVLKVKQAFQPARL
jgi:transposase